MDVQTIKLGRERARELYRAYKKHAHYSEPIDWELQRTYQLLAQGRLVIQALESIKQAGLGPDRLPRLAICEANAKEVYFASSHDGSGFFTADRNARGNSRKIEFASGSFSGVDRSRYNMAKALLPMIPLHLRPKRGLANYHILWEAEWTPVPVRDPYLLRRIGKGDIWLVVAAWELTEVERAALSTRINAA